MQVTRDAEERLEMNAWKHAEAFRTHNLKLLAMAEARWRRINGAHLIPLVRAGVQFVDGIQAERRSAA
jgi:hypothetical protein